MSQSFLTDVANVPLPQMLENLGLAIASTQQAMDANAVNIAKMMGDKENYGVQFSGDNEKRSLLELGFSPTFYHLSEATIDLKVSLSMSTSTEVSAGVKATVGAQGFFVFAAATISASYSNKYSYDAASSSGITARFIAVPPPSTFHEYLGQHRNKDNAEPTTTTNN